MSDTPETDSYANRDWWTLFRANEHARELERQRDEAREKAEQQRKEIVRLNGATNHAGGTPLKIALRERDEAREALSDMLSGWRYIRKTHGDIYGVGWERAQTKAEKVLEEAK
jgi:hypothetical protein